MEKTKLLVVTAIWIILSLIGFGFYKLVFYPMLAEEENKQKQEEHEQVVKSTGSSSRYKHNVRIATDSFSGYAILRSKEFHQNCGNKGVKVDIVDIPDYNQRLSLLKSGDIHLAAFSVDALIKTSSAIGDLPGTIVSVIDESSGADSMWASKRISNLDDLNSPDTKFVVVGDSPSETFVDVVRNSFNLDRLADDPFIRVLSAQEVIQNYRISKPTDNRVFVTWQPDASHIASNPEYKMLMDSSRLRGYIVDTLVVSRDFLVKNEAVVQDLVKAYFQSNFDIKDKASLVASDSALELEVAKKIAEGIRWRNTQENYAHFGLIHQPGYLHLEDIIANITNMLIDVGSLKSDPTNGQPNLLYYDRVMKKLLGDDFHPGTIWEEFETEQKFNPLTEEEWKSLVTVGTMHIPPIVFPRGSTKIGSSSEPILSDVVEKLQSWPQYYLVVTGHAKGTSPADLEAQKVRANSVSDWLIDHGINKNRIRVEPSESNGSTTVKFRFVQTPY